MLDLPALHGAGDVCAGSGGGVAQWLVQVLAGEAEGEGVLMFTASFDPTPEELAVLIKTYENVYIHYSAIEEFRIKVLRELRKERVDAR